MSPPPPAVEWRESTAGALTELSSYQTLAKKNPDPEAVERAQRLREEATLPETLLWNALMGVNLPFRVQRKYEVGTQTLGYYFPKAKTALEIDASGDDRDAEGNAARDLQLRHDFGIQTMRVSSERVLDDPAEVAKEFVELACRRAGLPSPF